MKRVEVSENVGERLDDLFKYIINEYKAPNTAHKYINDINEFLQTLGGCFALAKCRRKKWLERGYLCAVFKRYWVFAYKIYDDRVIIHDMEYAPNISDV